MFITQVERYRVVSHSLRVALLFRSRVLQKLSTEDSVASRRVDTTDDDDDDDIFGGEPRARDTVLVPSDAVRIAIGVVY